MIARVADLLGMIKFSHTLFALPFALLGAALAAHSDEGWRGRVIDWIAILACMTTARSAAMAFNRLVDRKIDAENPRTVMRHLPAGTLSVREVMIFTVISSVGFIASTALFLPNYLPLVFSVPVLLWLLGYSFAKRFTSLAHLWLGVALGLAPLCAWVAFRASVAWPPVWLGLAVVTWVTGFDIIYACQDEAFDRTRGLHSIPARLGTRGALRLAAFCHALTVVFLVMLGETYPLGRIYFIGLGAVTCLLIYEHAIVKPSDLSRVNVAFFQVNILISIGLFLVGLADLFLS